MKEPFLTGKPCRTYGGIRVPHKKLTAAEETVTLPIPLKVVIPMQMHIGAPSAPTVAVGDRVLVGDKIGEAVGPLGVPVHASVSGTVTAVGPVRVGGGATVTAVTIESDGKMEPAAFAPPTVTDRTSFLAAVRESGLVGLGGAGFPTYKKLDVPSGKTVDTLLINAAECEPYLTGDHRGMLEDPWSVMSGIYAVKQALGIPRAILCVEANKPDAIALLKQMADSSADTDDSVRLLTLRTSYPQGAEKVLIRAATGREVPKGGLPADAGCIVLNVTGAAAIARYLKTGEPLTAKRLTVSGSAVLHPQNVLVPIGTPVSEVLSFCGLKEEPKKVLFGGPMMGTALDDLDVPIVKNNNGITAMGAKEARISEPIACIRCGRCVHACPMRLSPLDLANATAAQDTEALAALELMSCMECGCCSYSCPAHRPLTQSMRLGKALLRAATSKKN